MCWKSRFFKFVIICVSCLAAIVGVLFCWTFIYFKTHPQYPPKGAIEWQTGLTTESNGMRLNVEVISSDAFGKFRTTVTDLRTGEQWKDITEGERPLFLCNDRSRVLVAQLAHGLGGFHLFYWSYRKHHEMYGNVLFCIPRDYFTNSTCLTISPDGNRIATTCYNDHNHAYEATLLVSGLEKYPDAERNEEEYTVLRSDRNLYTSFDGDRLRLDDRIHHYVAHFGVFEHNQNRMQIDKSGDNLLDLIHRISLALFHV